jgi:hypothetical protein
VKTMTHHKQWKRLAPLGLIGVGLGVSLSGQATIWKARQEPAWKWVALGTAGLICLNAGLSCFGDAVKHRALHEWTETGRNTA